jgi:hypothetical protein
VLNLELGREMLRPMDGNDGRSSDGGLGRNEGACIDGAWWMFKPIGLWWMSVDAVVNK